MSLLVHDAVYKDEIALQPWDHKLQSGARKRGGLKRVTGLVCVFSAAASFAACANPMPVSKEMSESEVIILGTVVSSHQVPQAWDSLDGTDYVVHIDQKVKGKPSGEITIFSERTDDAVNLESGKQYLLFLNNNYQHWVVNKCGNSGPIDEKRDVIKQMVHALGND
jgi:hypothetical protein